LLKGFGADVTIDYKKSEEDIIAELKSATGGKLNYAFDAVSVNNNLVTAVYTALAGTTSGARVYTTTNDSDPAPTDTSFKTNLIELGLVGRPEGAELNKTLNGYIPVIFKLIESGKIKSGEWSVEGEGIEGLLKAWEVQRSGKKGSTKVIVKVADV
jgi:threonine dehydrogenase-like Zn-dependent dehydrogenase